MNSATVDVNGLATYYEVRGSGRPLLLLHGGLMPAETLLPQARFLAKDFEVYVPERRAHGRTPDVDGPLTYDAMAADTAAFIRHLGLSGCSVVGFSDGGIVALLLAINWPNLVGPIVAISANTTADGTYDGDELPQGALPDSFEDDVASSYRELSPDGADHWDIVWDKALAMWQSGAGITTAQLATISARTLVMAGDNDVIRPEHTRYIADTIPSAQLSIIPGTGHLLMVEKPHLVNPTLLDFVSASPERA
jgi:pimeloyl-ACP methyl ester carboxylesterase